MTEELQQRQQALAVRVGPELLDETVFDEVAEVRAREQYLIVFDLVDDRIVERNGQGRSQPTADRAALACPGIEQRGCTGLEAGDVGRRQVLVPVFFKQRDQDQALVAVR